MARRIVEGRGSRALLLAAAAVVAVAGCGASDGGGGSGAGGSGAGGTKSSSGGSSGGGGGSSPTGGATGAGGSAGGGGAASAGGATGTGDAGTATGGATGTAGAGGNDGGAGGRAGSGGNGGGGRGGSGGAGGRGGGGGGGGTGGGMLCPSPALKPGDTTRTISVGGQNRTYVLHVPSPYTGTAAVPLVVDFHPLGGSGSAERSGSPYPAQTDKEGVVMAFPSGLSGPSGGAWNVGPCCVANVDDVAFARALVADVAKTACIDPKRVYAVGFSMGGGMSHYLACHAADVFAAVAPAAFDLLQENVGGCTPARPITVISFRGTADPLVPYGGGPSSVVAGMPVNFLGAKATMDRWAQLNGCTGAASAADGNNCSSYTRCDGGVEVWLCTKTGGGHEAGNASVGWPVLKRHALP